MSLLEIVMHLRSCCFTNVILMIFFCRSRCRRSPRRLIKLSADPSTIFLIFDVDYLGKSRRHHRKERLTSSKIAWNLKVILVKEASLCPHHTNVCKLSAFRSYIFLMSFQQISLKLDNFPNYKALYPVDLP